MIDYIKKCPIKRYIDGEIREEYDDVLMEYILSIHVDGKLFVKLICIPEDLEALTIGYLYSESLISSVEQIRNLELNMDEGYVNVKLDTKKTEGKQIITTDSGDFLEIPYQFQKLEENTLKEIPWSAPVILKNANLLLTKSEAFKKTGNVHSVMLCLDDKVLYFSEDIGRYNAFDKTIGKALKDNVDFSKTTVYTSGRLPSSIAQKAIRCGVPILVSRSAPTYRTLEISKKHNLTIIGFAKNNNMNIY